MGQGIQIEVAQVAPSRDVAAAQVVPVHITLCTLYCTVLYAIYHILYTLYVNSILHNLHYRYTLYILHLMLFNMANLGEVVLMAQKMHNNYPHHTSSVSRSVRYTLFSRSFTQAWDIHNTQGLSPKCVRYTLCYVQATQVWDSQGLSPKCEIYFLLCEIYFMLCSRSITQVWDVLYTQGLTSMHSGDVQHQFPLWP